MTVGKERDLGRRERHRRVNVGRRTRPSADAVGTSPITSKGRDVRPVATLQQLLDDVGDPFERLDNWGKKAIRRKTTGTGRMRYLKDIPTKLAPHPDSFLG